MWGLVGGSRSPKISLDSNFFSKGPPPLKITSLKGVTSCSPLPSPTLKCQVIASLQLGRKEQEGTCDLEGGTNAEKNRVQELKKTCYFEAGGGLHRTQKTCDFERGSS